MGMDGFSISNTGIKESTSAEITNKTEQAMAMDPANSRQIQGLSDNERVKEKEDEEKSRQNRNQQPEQNDEFEDGLVEEDEDTQEDLELDVEDIENPNKDFYVKLNIKDDIIELYDTATDRLVETISGTELGKLVQKLNMASGIFVNKKV